MEIILETKGIEYQKEVAIHELDNKRFDYYLPEYNIFIEFDGAQHHYPVEYFGGNEAYIKQVQTDTEKAMWCYQNGYKFLRLNHLMSLNMINNLIDYNLNIELKNENKKFIDEEINNIEQNVVNEHEKELPYIEEWAKSNLNYRDLYINELFNDYNNLLKQILGNKYMLKDKVEFEEYIKNYNDQIIDKGIIKRNNKYTKYYINEKIDIEDALILNKSNIVDLFIENLQNIGILEYSYLPSKLIYEYYKQWLYENNLSINIKPMKIREFGQRFNKKIKEYGYVFRTDKRLNKIKKYEFNSKLLMSLNDLNEKTYNKSNYYNVAQSNSMSKILINKDLLFNDNDVEEITDILTNTEKFDQLNNYSLPIIQYCIENLCQNKLSLLTNLQSIDNMYLLSKEELITKLNI